MSFYSSKLLPNAGMECSLYVFLLTIFKEHYKPSKSSFLSRTTKTGVPLENLLGILPRAAANKETKPSGVSNSNCQSYYKFERFNSWTCNAPQALQFGTALLVVKPSTTIPKYRYRILVYGGQFAQLTYRTTSAYLLNQTWIYHEETNSWKLISVANSPPAMSGFYLVALCSSRAIIVSFFS